MGPGPARIASLLCCALLGAPPAAGEPPPGHPNPAQAGRLLGMPRSDAANLPHAGVVLQAIDSNQYTYIEVMQDGQSRWIAAPRMPLAPGATIRFDDGRLMTNFHSLKLNRTFETLTFVGTVVVTAQEGAK